jgi:hypothetical protein
MRRVPQEAKSERALFGFMAITLNAIAVKRVKRRLVRVAER